VDDEVFGFHAQQAVEKLYKALITMHGISHPFTHDLPKLLNELAALGEQPPSLTLTAEDLTDFAVESRYESGKPFTKQEREDLRASIVILREFVNERREALRLANIPMQNP